MKGAHLCRLLGAGRLDLSSLQRYTAPGNAPAEAYELALVSPPDDLLTVVVDWHRH